MERSGRSPCGFCNPLVGLLLCPVFWVAVSLETVISKSDRQSWLAMAQAPASVRQQRDLVEEALQRGAWQVPNPEIG